MIRPVGFGFSPAQPHGQQAKRPNQAGGKPSSFAANPASANGSALALGQGSTDSDVTSSTNDLESLISQLPSDLQDLFQGYLDTSVSTDKDPSTLMSDLGTLQDSVNTVLEQVQANPDQPIDPSSVDTPSLMADDAYGDMASPFAGSADPGLGGVTGVPGGSTGAFGSPAGAPGGPTGIPVGATAGRPSFGVPGSQGHSSSFSIGGAGAAMNLGSASAAPRSLGVLPAHVGSAVPGMRLNMHA